MGLSAKIVAGFLLLSLLQKSEATPGPAPLPQPFFGLLGRLLASAAFSSGEKEEECDCRRRTFHQKEKNKKPCDCYGAPSEEYGAPSEGYGAPEQYDSYGAPVAPVVSSGYTSPAVDSYGAPVSYETQSYEAPSYSAPSSGYGAPCSSYTFKRRTFHQKEKEKKNPCEFFF